MTAGRTFTHIIAFTTLFVAYAMPGQTERPAGVRRALQTLAAQIPAGALAMPVDCGAIAGA